MSGYQPLLNTAEGAGLIGEANDKAAALTALAEEANENSAAALVEVEELKDLITSAAYANRLMTLLYANLPAASGMAEGVVAEVTADSTAGTPPFKTKTGIWQVQLVGGVKTWVQLSDATTAGNALRVNKLEQRVSEQGDAEGILLGLNSRRRVGYALGERRLLSAGLHVREADDGSISIATRAGAELIEVSPEGEPTYAGLPVSSVPDLPGVGLMMLDSRGRGKAFPDIVSVPNIAGADLVLLDRRGRGIIPPRVASVPDIAGTDMVLLDRRGRGKIPPRIATVPNIPGVDVMLLDRRGRGKPLISAGAGGGGDTASSFSAADIAGANARAAQISAAVRATLTSDLVVPTWGLTLYLIAGQSLSVGFEAWPILRPGAIRDVLMMGTSIHPHVASGATWGPMGNAGGLNPFVRTVRGSGSGTLLDAAGQAALVAPAANPGVTPLDGAMDQFRAAWLRRFALPADPSRKFVVAEAGVGGTTIGEWLPGASPELFNRLRTAILAAQTEATNLGVTFGVGGLIWVQGENDYSDGTTRADYVNRATTVFQALRAFVATTTGQAGVLPIWLAQTGGPYTKDDQALAVANAQLDLCENLPGVFMAGSTTPVFDKGGHLAPNGSEWLGNQIGRAMDITQLRGEGWEPCRAIRWTRKGREALCEAHTPVAPLQFLQGWVGSAPAAPANQGIELRDSLGTVPIASVEIVAPQVIRVTAARDFGSNVTAWLGTQANVGAISIADSDTSPLVGTYVYTEGSGQAADQNIASRVGLPYQTANWMVASVLPVTPA